jgi:mycofactocin glycosyltransferase
MAKELRDCLESLRRQTYNRWECIVVNDASSDGTPDVVAEYQGRFGGNLSLVSNPVNLGVAGARNVGIRHAKGELIAFTDADCVVTPDWLSEIVRTCVDPGIAAVGGRIMNDDCRNIWELSEKGHDYVSSVEGPVGYIQGCNMAFDAGVLQSYMFNDEIKYGYEEALLCDSLVRDGHRIWYNPRVVVHHKHRASLRGLLKQKYNRGYSSIWYRKKQAKFPMLKRHFLMLLSLLLLPACLVNGRIGYVIALLISAVIFGLVRDEYMYRGKTTGEIWVTLPVVLGTELSHFAGAFCGLAFFWLRRAPA